MGSILGKPNDLYGYLIHPPEYPIHLMNDLLVKEGTYGMVFGEASSAKSLIVQAMIVAIASGEKFAGHFSVNGGTRNVLFLDLDQGADTSLRRFAKLVNWPSYEDDWKEGLAEHIFHYSPTKPFTVFEPAHCAELASEIKENQIDMLVIDCLARTLGGGDENATTTADQYFKAIKILQDISLRDGRPLTVLIVHHSRKAPVGNGQGAKAPLHDDMRGASGWRDSLDFQIRATKKRDLVWLTKLKERNAETPDGKWCFRIYDRMDEHGDGIGVKFNYEPDAEIQNQAAILWSELSKITEGNKDKAIGLKALSDDLKARAVAGIPHSTGGLKPILFHLCEAKKVQCTNQEYAARDPHKRFWAVRG